jgi:PPK2 family polyphosphate:nucleotide phosphotransferase
MGLIHRVKPGERISLKDIDAADTAGVGRDDAEARLAALNPKLAELEELHYAAGQDGILIVLQGPDTAGKDGTIRHVMAQFNPASCRVEAFKEPTPEELAHDFLWRIHRATPPRGSIAIFNRSHYEQVLVVRVHKLEPKKVWERHYEQINHFERLLADSGTLILKFLLYISKAEQKERLLAREADPDKAWKLSPSDWPEHERYGDYIDAYEDALRRCSTDYAPWYIVPADHKWFRNLAVAQTILDVLDPYRKEWKEAVEARGKAALQARAAQRAAGRAP